MGIFDFSKYKKIVAHANVAIETEDGATEMHKLPLSVVIGDDEIPSLDERLQSAFPSNNGLYPHEIMMLYKAHSYSPTSNHFPYFWKWKYSVLDPKAVLDSLYERGFIRIGDIKDSLQEFTVKSLQELLKSIGEKTTGKKESLIDRILEKYDSENLSSVITERYYTLTELGERELRENEYVPYLHKHEYLLARDLSAWKMNIILHTDNFSNLSYRDIIWRELEKQSRTHFENCDFGLYRNTRLDMYSFVLEDKNYSTALNLLIEVISFDLSGLGNQWHFMGDDSSPVKFNTDMVNLFKSADKSEITLPPKIIEDFKRLYNQIGMLSDEFIAYTYELFKSVRIHNRIFTDVECANIILSEIGLEERKLKNSFMVAEKRVMESKGQ